MSYPRNDCIRSGCVEIDRRHQDKFILAGVFNSAKTKVFARGIFDASRLQSTSILDEILNQGWRTAVAIENEILAYLAENPDAEDTVEGIAQWWLLEQRIQRTHAEVKATLDKLVARNLVVVHQGPDGRVYYSANAGYARAGQSQS